MKGTSFQRISTHAIEQAIKKYANSKSAVAFTYQNLGHAFYVLVFDEATWVYDAATGLWHEWLFSNLGEFERHRLEHLSYIPKKGIFVGGDYSNNKVYLLNDETYTDDGTSITRLRTSPHISNELRRVFYSEFLLDAEVGVGLPGDVVGS